MSPNNLTGSIVTLRSSQGPIRRFVVEDRGDILVISRQEEVEAAKREGRAPATVGFKRSDVLKEA
jgi:hypothetical protein